MPPSHHLSHHSSHFKSGNFLSTISKTDAPNSIYHKPNVSSSGGRIGPIQLPAIQTNSIKQERTAIHPFIFTNDNNVTILDIEKLSQLVNEFAGDSQSPMQYDNNNSNDYNNIPKNLKNAW
ncbi:11792_t:CDS:2 [Ambispora leptoticha]|uniref:11792_t:CDS:1 n=1 Tax=Ambispora leptoticha TaxID=144679 RepID=A0A9N9BDB1_9GLOM|nr:11792_t:CDS:2 [Ambispora leptoticha]